MARQKTESDPLDRLSNWRIAVLALYSLGGGTSRQDGEDVALKCYEIAPRRFGWEKHRQYPHLELARAALRDAKKEKYGVFVTGDEATGWLLTEAGLAWCEDNAERLGAGRPRRGLSALAEPEARALRQLAEHRLFEQWNRGERDIALYEVADALRFPADAPRQAVQRRVKELVGAAHVAQIEEVGGFLEWLDLNVVS
ncbi:MAG: hypothetical protein OXH41_07410 [Chloroflexi bacterium]|nr:hypothetical protein [Chloroflexota bacterium]